MEKQRIITKEKIIALASKYPIGLESHLKPVVNTGIKEYDDFMNMLARGDHLDWTEGLETYV